MMLITTTENIPGKNYEILGEVFGSITQSRNAMSDFGAGVKSFFGGEIGGYTKMINRARKQAIERMQADAQNQGADAIVMMRFDSSLDSTGMQSVTAYGTAVKFVDND